MKNKKKLNSIITVVCMICIPRNYRQRIYNGSSFGKIPIYSLSFKLCLPTINMASETVKGSVVLKPHARSVQLFVPLVLPVFVHFK